MFERRRRMRVAGVAALAAAGLLATACGSSTTPSSTSTKSVKGAVATLPIITGTGANAIFPLETTQFYSVANYEDFQYLMVRPLYMFGGNSSTSTAVDYADSPASTPVYSNGGRTVVINLKPWKWSNGQTVDASDLIFMLNMLEANKANDAGYTPGLLPDNLASYKATGPEQVTLQLTQAYSSIWFTYNQLAILYPFPLTWDTTSTTGAADSGGCLTDSAADKWAKCIAVWKFLNSQNSDTSTFATNPLWKVVDGPYKLTAYNVDGNFTLVPNPDYSGHKAQVTLKFEEFTSDTAVYTALRTGTLASDWPNWPIAPGDLPEATPGKATPPSNPLASAGYTIAGSYQFGIGYAYINFNNPTYGPIFRQLYFRQAMMELDDQLGMSKAAARGYWLPTDAGVPAQPPGSQWISPVMKENGGAGPYPYNVSKAESLLAAHGWKNTGGVLTCQSSACGSGIKVGAQAKFTFMYTSGISTQAAIADVLKSGFAQAGIQLTLVPETFDSLLNYTVPCTPSQAECSKWTLLYLGGWLFNGPGFEPTGEPLYSSNAPNNSGSYSNATMNSLINATHTSNSMTPFYSYADWTATQVPSLWMPWTTTQVANSNNLHNATENPYLTWFPEYWTCGTKTC
ncbi:MAG TPA: ABC transporter substrate-binding protein [Streptosporangiaceae bacterium]|nr:ABC transporter substrate-binding protein [Streptosporangiaceae bacterium]